MKKAKYFTCTKRSIKHSGSDRECALWRGEGRERKSHGAQRKTEIAWEMHYMVLEGKGR